MVLFLAICSKNDISNARNVFEQHPHMPLNLEDFAVIKCNWQDKAQNLSEIAQELNLDISSLVFVDDNPVECELIKQVHPLVRVVEMSDDPAGFVRKLDSLRYFETQSLTREDLNRSKSYQARFKVKELMTNATDIKSFLSSLDMAAEIFEADSRDLIRLVQMEAKN